MAAIALVLIILCLLFVMLLSTVHTTYRIEEDILGSTILLSGCLLGIVIAALIASCVINWNKKKRKAALRMHGWQILALDDDNTMPAASSSCNTYVKRQESVSVTTPGPTSSCRGHHANSHKTSTLIDHNESQHYMPMDRHQHKKTTDHQTSLNFTSGTTLNIITESPVPVSAPIAENRIENITLDQDRVSSRNPSQLESYC